MSYYLDFDKQEKGYQRISPSKDLFKERKGEYIVYITSENIDRHRGYAFPRYAKIHGVKRNSVIIDEYGQSVSIRDIIECGIKITT